MLILAIDTTGFSTSVALVKDGQEVIYNKIKSVFVPNKHWSDFILLLPDRHRKFLISDIKNFYQKKGVSWANIDAIAVSAGSGIYNCVLVGVSIAETLAYCYKKPLIKVDHILAHIYSTWLGRKPGAFQFPILVFSASGSHSDFSLITSTKCCKTIYDTVPNQNMGGVGVFIGIGKVFDIVGRKLGIITPKDAHVNKLITAASQGDPFKYDFKKYYHGPALNLDFTGFLEATNRFIENKQKEYRELPQKFIKDTAASAQESLTEILAGKITRLALINKVKEVHIAGGISQNQYLKKKIQEKIKKKGCSYILRYPVKKEYRLDNAAMIGALAYYQEKYKIRFKNFKPNITI